MNNRDSEVFKKYLESRGKEEEEKKEQEGTGEGDFRKRTRRRHPPNRLRNAGRTANVSFMTLFHCLVPLDSEIFMHVNLSSN